MFIEKSGLVMKYFILKPNGDTPHAKASRAAMEAYAFVIKEENPKLASEIQEWVRRELKKHF